jgi:aerobic carbon-monoxide dehydrogenase medium subunit
VHGERELSAEDFFVTHLTTALKPDELLAEIVVPAIAPDAGTAIVEHARVHGDFALGGAAVVIGAGRRSVVLLAAGPTPVRAAAVQDALAGGAEVEEAAALAAEAVDASRGDYRRALAAELTRRALVLATERAAA